jgi:hypothetical protein
MTYAGIETPILYGCGGTNGITFACASLVAHSASRFSVIEHHLDERMRMSTSTAR